MKNCPQCGQARIGEEFKCPHCDVFYSQLDELLFEEQQRLERDTLAGAVKRIRAASDRKQALKRELAAVWRKTPLRTKIVLWTVVAFLFVLIVPVI
ncbi:hypothetical protein [Methylomonas sp. DH-1]|uniref:hypothetical protein n=1 Tax=Methylomonas sp. (strain DH-1) TaxID=1727196 RepID=UPI0007C912D7|nr:hypothetical protein [Methylomonas sp. DH-1]ANE54153.1 hypothetical protein AYM39_02405 [Methylomonas sp. DH-1]